ncbi:MAG: PQQ-dependent sugar dehydrogenase, partial [Novosphingobium sp.]
MAAIATQPSPGFAADVPEVGVPSELSGPGPFIFPSAELATVKVDIIARGLSHAYSLTFLPGGDALIVERGARLRLVRQATGGKTELVAQPIANVPEYSKAPNLHPFDVLGIQDVKLHPQFATNRLIYFTYNRPVGFDAAAKRITAATVLAQARLDGLSLTDVKDLLVGEPRVAVGGSRILIGREGHLFVAVGALSEGDIQSSQRKDNIYGKVLRIGLDGSIPATNPFSHTKGARREIWT